MQSNHRRVHSSVACMTMNGNALCPILPVSRCTCISLWVYIALSGLHLLSIKLITSVHYIITVWDARRFSTYMWSTLWICTKQITTINSVFVSFKWVLLAFRQVLSPIYCQELVANSFIPLCGLNLAYTFHQFHFHPLLPNPFSIFKTFSCQPVLWYCQNITNIQLLVEGSILHLYQTVLSLHNAPPRSLQNCSHWYFIPLIECTEVGLNQHFGK